VSQACLVEAVAQEHLVAVKLDPTQSVTRLGALDLEAAHPELDLDRSFEAGQEQQMPFLPV
jgi:hypothetical protein